MSVNMPQLHTLLSNALVPRTIDAMLLITVTGAIVISASSLPPTHRQRTSIALAAIATETWANSREGAEQSSSEQSQTPENERMASTSNETQGGWATTEVMYRVVVKETGTDHWLVHLLVWKCVCLPNCSTVEITVDICTSGCRSRCHVLTSCQWTRGGWLGSIRGTGE